MANIAHSLTAFAQLSNDERERSLQLIDAFNGAVAELRTAGAPHGDDPSRLFSFSEIEDLVGHYRASRLSKLGPAMTRYLLLLDRGYRWPAIV